MIPATVFLPRLLRSFSPIGTAKGCQWLRGRCSPAPMVIPRRGARRSQPSRLQTSLARSARDELPAIRARRKCERNAGDRVWDGPFFGWPAPVNLRTRGRLRKQYDDDQTCGHLDFSGVHNEDSFIFGITAADADGTVRISPFIRLSFYSRILSDKRFGIFTGKDRSA